ncbi:helix-turn-helix transcriptional regulator [Kineosporia sp. R_H_3]|uniref:ArsR/SmtB family transcription factor n=1 Tax=Kineosporia sp. R_H_3 TaxID=1961848 RepID=UPI000B4B2757|nr:winged helix-turn-helix domain-containing protein [Kineosporia sp. R_H_3]
MADDVTPGPADLSVPARAMAEPARARMLDALVDGRAWTASELARAAGVAASTASGHLKVLTDHGLVTVTASGRHRYFALAGPDVARAVEALQAIAPRLTVRSLRQQRVSADLRAGRTCYDHLAGDLGLRVTDLLVDAGCLAAPETGRDVPLADPLPAHPVVERFAVAAVATAPAGGRRPVARGCLDWTGRRPHLAGRLGAHLLTVFRDRGWVEPRPGSRALRLTATGAEVLAALERALLRTGRPPL